MSPLKVLVVDDERFFREAIQDVLAAASVPCVLASTGTEALELAADEAIGVVILDLQLPDLHGLEVFRRLREDRPDLRVVILSASTDQDDVLTALRLGAFDYLAKPLHEEELALAVSRAGETFEIARGWSGLRGRLQHLEETLADLVNRAREASAAELREAVVDAVATVLQASRTSLLLVDDDEGALRVAAVRGHKSRPEDMDLVPVGEGPAGLALARRESLLVQQAGEDPRFADRVPHDRYATASFAVAPLLDEGRAFGVLCATERHAGAPLGEDDLALLRILAGQAARLLRAPVAEVEAAVLLEPEPAADEAPADADGETQRIAAGGGLCTDLLREICEAVGAEIEPARVFDAALKPVSERVGAAPVSIFLLDPTTGVLRRDAERDGGHRSDRAELPGGRGLAGVVVGTGAIVATEDPASDPRFDAEIDTPADGAAGPLLCGPLRFRGRSLGLFRVFPDQAGRASAEVGEALAAGLSAAVRAVVLYRSLIESIEEVARARRESTGL